MSLLSGDDPLVHHAAAVTAVLVSFERALNNFPPVMWCATHLRVPLAPHSAQALMPIDARPGRNYPVWEISATVDTT